ncbi:DUF6303 family protein [Streptomyces sp. NPDC047117]|uniref:DUF6303 family protein n=1 Tax=Streptomyces sp. NPDC047117 TaxID=3155379 RepID=UPI0034052ADE
MPKTFQAQMADSGGRWHLYVVLLSTPVSQWPEHEWPRTAPTPTLTERARTLAGLGYEVAPAAEWEWIEDSDTPGDPASPVRLIATVTVRPLRKEGRA